MAKQQSQNPLLASLKGAVAGAAGTLVISLGLQYGPQLLQQAGLIPTPKKKPEEPTEKLADKVATETFDTKLGDDTKKAAGQSIRWTYGVGWGVVYGLAQNWLHLPHYLHGALFGTIIGGVASTVVPALGLTPPPTKQPPAMSAMQFVLHLAYGYTVAIVFHLLTPQKKNLLEELTDS